MTLRLTRIILGVKSSMLRAVGTMLEATGRNREELGTLGAALRVTQGGCGKIESCWKPLGRSESEWEHAGGNRDILRETGNHWDHTGSDWNHGNGLGWVMWNLRVCRECCDPVGPDGTKGTL